MSNNGYAVFNPHNKPEDELPTIYGFNNGGGPGWFVGMLLAEDGYTLGSHLCSSEGYMRHDLGVTKGSREDRHEMFRAHYPDGYRMDFVPYRDIHTHQGLTAAVERNKALPDDEDAEAAIERATGGGA